MSSSRKENEIQILGFGLNYYHQLGVAPDGGATPNSGSQPGTPCSPTRGLVRPVATPPRSRQNSGYEPAAKEGGGTLVSDRRPPLPRVAPPLSRGGSGFGGGGGGGGGEEAEEDERSHAGLVSLAVSAVSPGGAPGRGRRRGGGRGGGGGGGAGGVGTRALMPLPLHLRTGEHEGPVEELALGATFTVARTRGGGLYRWGLDQGRLLARPTPLPTGLPLRCTQVAAGRKHCLALLEGGYVASWGVGYFGQLGHGDNASYPSPQLVRRLDPQALGVRCTSVAAGGYHSAALTEAGHAFLWGFNRYGQCGDGRRENTAAAPKPADLRPLGGRRPVQLALGRHHSVLLTDDGQVYAWGAGTFGRLGLADGGGGGGAGGGAARPRRVLHLQDRHVAQLACGDFHTLALDTAGRVYSWGYGAEGQCGHGSALHLRAPRPVRYLAGLKIARVAAGAWWSFALEGAPPAAAGGPGGGTAAAAREAAAAEGGGAAAAAYGGPRPGRLWAWGCADGGWAGLDRPVDAPLVEPGPAPPGASWGDNIQRHGATRAFDSAHNALLPEPVEALAALDVLQVFCGGSHSFVFARPAVERPPPGEGGAWRRRRRRRRRRRLSPRGRGGGRTPSMRKTMIGKIKATMTNTTMPVINTTGSKKNRGRGNINKFMMRKEQK